jgi:hypothetical protein
MDQVPREQRLHMDKMESEIDEIRRTLKTPCFNNNPNSAHKSQSAAFVEKRVNRPKVVFPKMII